MANSDNEVVITYETLFEMLRIEKSRPELQKISKSFFEDVLGYIQDKIAILNKETSQKSLFASSEKENVRKELENIGRILKDLYSRREKKVVEMALIKSRIESQIVDTSAMLDIEKEMFKKVHSELLVYRKDNLYKLLNGENPTSISFTKSNLEKAENKENIYKETISPSKIESKQNDGLLAVRFLESLDQVVGPDLKVYGPFEQDAEAKLPKELADALINNSQAQLSN